MRVHIHQKLLDKRNGGVNLAAIKINQYCDGVTGIRNYDRLASDINVLKPFAGLSSAF